MKVFRGLLDQAKPHFTKGGKLEKFHYAYDAFETFLFVPGDTCTEGTHIKDGIDLKRTMFTVVSLDFSTGSLGWRTRTRGKPTGFAVAFFPRGAFERNHAVLALVSAVIGDGW